MTTKQAIVWAVAAIIGAPLVYLAIRLIDVATIWLATAVGVWTA